MRPMQTKKASNILLLTLLTGVMTMALTHAVVNNVLALFITPIAESLGVARSEVALMNTFISLASVIGAPVWGWLYGRTQTKKPLLFGILVLIAVSGGLSGASDLAQFYVLAFMMGFVFAGVAVMPVTLLILESAPERSRALMLSIALAGSGLGGVILNPVVNSAIQNQGYQRAFLLIGLLELVLLVPLVIMLPAKARKAPIADHDAANAEKSQPKTKLFKGPFLLLFFGTALTAFTSLAALLNFPSYLLLCGYGAGTVSLMTALGSGALMAGKILLGLLYDRLGLRKATLIVCIAVILGFVSLASLPSTAGLIGYVVFFGFGASIGTVTPSYLASSFYHKNRSQALGALQIAQGIGAALGTPLLARLLERFQPLQLAWSVPIAAALLMSYLLLGSVVKFQHGEQASPSA